MPQRQSFLNGLPEEQNRADRHQGETDSKEEKQMNDVIREVFKEDFDQAEEHGKEGVAENMLRDSVPVGKIEKWTGLSLEQIRTIAEKAGISTLII